MKYTQSFSRIALMALALGTASATTVFAQSTPPATTPPAPSAPTRSGKAKHESALTADEKAHLEKVRAQALTANPDLKTEADSIKAQRISLKSQGTATNPDAKAALKALSKQHEQKLEAAMLKIDPTVAPIFAKLKAAHKEKKAENSPT